MEPPKAIDFPPSVVALSTSFSHYKRDILSNGCRLDVIMIIFNICKLTLNFEVFPGQSKRGPLFFTLSLCSFIWLSNTLCYSFHFVSNFLPNFSLTPYTSALFSACDAKNEVVNGSHHYGIWCCPDHQRVNSSNVIQFRITLIRINFCEIHQMLNVCIFKQQNMR